ncbi:uncharacterized protein LOC111314936 [Durio zibethinus]|uniref:Uncharacterized protein LOC111314936 n=1 Tax=Durio zibethinus TaxID=66656 RepID=A0A6P6B563_DURZI|nr:uncharacterized protein LOC111314936 [Durio zibethinus]
MRSKYLMANYLRRSSKDVAGGRSKPNEGCKRHPKHRQSPGVCSLCLTEKLSQLSANSSSRCTTATKVAYSCSSSSSLSSYYSSSSSSSYSSPMHCYRFTTEGKGTSFSLLLFSRKNILTKSRSVAFASRMRSKEGEDKNKKCGFLSKLLHPKNTMRKEEATGLEHSRTVREILSSTRVH